MMLPRGASHPADYDAGSDIHADVRAQARASVEALYRLIEAGLRPRDIMTERAFENAITTVYAMGGSTNMYLHLLAIAREAQVPITIERIQQIGERVPLLANLQPHGPYAMVSLHALGGVPIVMKELLRAGLLHGDVMTVTGKTLAENLAAVPTLEELGKQDIVFPVRKPIAAPNNHISVLKGNLAPESCLLKLSGKTLEKGEFRGTAKVFESEADTMKAIRAGEIVPGTVIVVRNVGPVGGPGMPEMVMLTIQLQGRGLGEDVALITDGRFSGVSHGILIGHISPEAARGGPIAAVRDGDTIVIDPVGRTLNLAISDEELAQRMSTWRAPDLAVARAPGLGSRQVYSPCFVRPSRLRRLGSRAWITKSRTTKSIVIGAGVGGIYQIKRLADLGIKATVLELAPDLGGTWYWNRYPGARFDSESYTYGYSFSRELLDEWHWKERFSGQPENLRYLNYVADKFDLRRHMQFNCRVKRRAFGMRRPGCGD